MRSVRGAMKKNSAALLVLALTVSSSALVAGCADENDPKTWVSRLDDAAKRPAAVKRLGQFFEDTMTKANGDRNDASVKALLDTIAEPANKKIKRPEDGARRPPTCRGQQEEELGGELRTDGWRHGERPSVDAGGGSRSGGVEVGRQALVQRSWRLRTRRCRRASARRRRWAGARWGRARPVRCGPARPRAPPPASRGA